MTHERILVTGAAGSVAGQLLPGLTERYLLRLTDRRPIPHTGAETVLGDLTDRAFTATIVDGTQAIVHLAGNPHPGATWDQLAGPNADAVAGLLDAALAHRVRRVVLASSIHAMGVYNETRAWPVDPAWPAAPCCPYGATKVLGEALGKAYAHKFGLSVVCLRLGATIEHPPNQGALGAWLAPADLRQLIRRALSADVTYGVYHGVSANTRQHWDIRNAASDLGYEPAHDSEEYAPAIPADGDYLTCHPHGLTGT